MKNIIIYTKGANSDLESYLSQNDDYSVRTKKAEEIYFVDDNIHSLTVGATRSGKTRSVVLQTIGNLALAGESMILSDPKRRAV